PRTLAARRVQQVRTADRRNWLPACRAHSVANSPPIRLFSSKDAQTARARSVMRGAPAARPSGSDADNNAPRGAYPSQRTTLKYLMKPQRHMGIALGQLLLALGATALAFLAPVKPDADFIALCLGIVAASVGMV